MMRDFLVKIKNNLLLDKMPALQSQVNLHIANEVSVWRARQIMM